MWLLNDEALRGMRSFAHARTAADLRAFEAAVAAEPQASAPRNLKVAGNVAEISVDGVLTEKPNFLAWLFGGGFSTTYESIRAALASAQADSAVKEIVMNVNSPGGNVNGLFETLAAIEAVSKPIRVRASQAASAAYAIAASAGRIEAVGPASSFGSIGVATSIYVDDSIVDIASSKAPNKRPDVSTPEGKAVVQGELDAIHELFADSIARGRAATTKDEDIDTDFVNANFGRGGVLLAAEAKKRKMIDSYPKPAGRASGRKNASAGDGGAESPTVTIAGDTEHMTREQLKAAHPEVYAAIVAEGEAAGEAKGRADGTTSERKRVCAHLKLAETTGAHKVARAAIESGASTMDEDVHADYMTAAMNRNAITARETEGAAAAAVTAGATAPVEGASAGAAPEGGKDFGDHVADRLDALMGRKPKAKS